MVESACRDGQARKRNGFGLAIRSVTPERNGESMLFDVNKASRTGGRKLFTETESIGGELSHGVIDD
jgi:hypothetical protein